MDGMEKLVELLEERRMQASEVLGSMNKGFGAWYADHLIANGVTVQEWILVKDRLPEIASKHKRGRNTYTKSIRVLCVCVQKDGKTMVKEGYCEWFYDYPEPCWKIPGTIDSVTHWAYLPQPPKGE